MRKWMTTTAATLAMAAGLLLAPSPAQAAAPLTISWGAPAQTPANKRVIEVVDKVAPSNWHVGAAVNWLDRYTVSDMRLVSRCSGRAYRCITIRGGKVSGANVGWSSGSTITIDTSKAASRKYRGWYRHDSTRKWLLIHELGHQFGLGHSTGRNLMNPYVNRYKLVLTKGQKSHLHER